VQEPVYDGLFGGKACVLPARFQSSKPLTSLTERIEWFIEGKALSRSYDLAPRPPLYPSPVSKVDRQHTGRLRKRDNLIAEGSRDGRGAGHMNARKLVPREIIQYSLVALQN
jgi:hypothetical protein